MLSLKNKYSLNDFLYKSFVQFHSNSKILPENYLQPLVEAARSHCYVENVSEKADSLHRRIKQGYAEDIYNAYVKVIVPWIKKQHLCSVMLAMDSTDEDFYGATSNMWLHPWTGEAGVRATHKFMVMSLVGKQKIPLLAVPMHCGMSKATTIQQFLALARKLFKHIRCILLDAGFYSGEVIEELDGYKYIIRASKHKNVQAMIAATEKWDSYDHEIVWNGNKTKNKTKTKIVIVKQVRFKNLLVDCSFATNMRLSDGMSYVHLYCKRWQIETNFRMQDQVHIKSKSLSVIIRYFYFMISMLLHAVWLMTWSHKISLDMFKVRLAHQLFLATYGIDYVHAVL